MYSFTAITSFYRATQTVYVLEMLSFVKQKAHKTDRSIIEGADIRVLCSYGGRNRSTLRQADMKHSRI